MPSEVLASVTLDVLLVTEREERGQSGLREGKGKLKLSLTFLGAPQAYSCTHRRYKFGTHQ